MRKGSAAPARLRASPLVVTGGAGFIGCNLAARLAREGHDVLVLDSLARPGVTANLEWLLEEHGSRVSFIQADVRDTDAVKEAVRGCSGVFHLAAQVAVTSSVGDPRHDLEVNLQGTFNVLEAARRSGTRPPVIVASTNKVYGSMADLPVELRDGRYRPLDEAIARHGIAETRPLSFHTPYGCSKGAADQYALDYCATFGVPTAVLRMSCIYGPRQCGTEDQGWVAHFAASVLTGRPIAIFGDGCQVRDVLHVDDAVEAYLRAFQRIDAVAGKAFNLGGGPANAVSLINVIDLFPHLCGRAPQLSFDDWRPGDQRYYVSDTRSIVAALDLPPPMPWRQGIAHLFSFMAVRSISAEQPSKASASLGRQHAQEAS